ncbi:MAG TPA: peptide deformylase [Candidatus Omnitrophota bacterium]|nr:peptide deformylase [Candidatus Omnitrophota bacterium]
MELLDIKRYPESILREKCAPVAEITDKERRLFEEMLFTMRHCAGIGLAAPQVGIARNMIVADIGKGAVQLANPLILWRKGGDHLEEGCLSIPGVSVNIERSYEVAVSGLNEKGQAVELKAKGLMARVLQHEIDHLKGRLIVDYLSLFERMKLKFRR